MKNGIFALKANPKVVTRISLLLLGKETGLGFFNNAHNVNRNT